METNREGERERQTEKETDSELLILFGGKASRLLSYSVSDALSRLICDYSQRWEQEGQREREREERERKERWTIMKHWWCKWRAVIYIYISNWFMFGWCLFDDDDDDNLESWSWRQRDLAQVRVNADCSIGCCCRIEHPTLKTQTITGRSGVLSMITCVQKKID